MLNVSWRTKSLKLHNSCIVEGNKANFKEILLNDCCDCVHIKMIIIAFLLRGSQAVRKLVASNYVVGKLWGNCQVGI